MARVRIAYIGGGSTRAPAIALGLIKRAAAFAGSELVLIDVDEGRLGIIERLARRMAEAAGADIRTRAVVTGWTGDTTLDVTSPAGRQTIAARAVVLATGARERPRSARLIPGDRGSGVYTTGHLQNLVHVQRRTVGRRG